MAEFYLSAFADEAGATLDEQIAALRENGIGYIEPRCIDGKNIIDIGEAELKEIYEKLSSNGIRVSSLGSPIGKFSIDDNFDEHLKAFEKAIRACKILKTDKMRMFSFYVSQENLKEKRDEVIRRLNVMARIAADAGITLCHENESLIYGQMPAEVEDVIKNVPGIKAVFDAANYRMNNADVYDGINATLINLGYMHIKDAIFESQMIVPAGEGEGKIGEIIDIVNEKCDFPVYLSLEPHLFGFAAYQLIDSHELKGKYSYKNAREAFDTAAQSLKKLLTEHGYREESAGKWIK